jgi:uncharacterized protein
MELLDRGIEQRIREAWTSVAIVTLEGPRASGKTTLARLISQGNTFFDLSDSDERSRALESVRAWVESLPVPSAIDEAQLVPELSISLKRRIDLAGGAPGQFLVTGSARIARNELGGSDPLVGRVLRLKIYPFAQSEIEGRPLDVVDALFNGDRSTWLTPELSQREVLDRICRGGLPGALELADAAKAAFFENYATGLFQGEVYETNRNRDQILRLFRWLVPQSGQLVEPTKFGVALELSKLTVDSYLRELREVFLIDRVQAWNRKKEKRETTKDRLFAFDPAFVCAALGLPGSLKGPLVDSDHGSVFETFAMTELSKLLSWSKIRGKLFHWRTGAGEEVDLIIEDQQTGKLIAIEVKAAREARESHFKGIHALKRAYPDQFHRGYVLHCGDHPSRFTDDLWSIPFSALWSIGEPLNGRQSTVDSALSALRDRLSPSNPGLLFPAERDELARLMTEGPIKQAVSLLLDLAEVLIESGLTVDFSPPPPIVSPFPAGALPRNLLKLILFVSLSMKIRRKDRELLADVRWELTLLESRVLLSQFESNDSPYLLLLTMPAKQVQLSIDQGWLEKIQEQFAEFVGILGGEIERLRTPPPSTESATAYQNALSELGRNLDR